MLSFVKEVSHATSSQPAMYKQASVARKASFELGPSVLRPQTALTLVKRRPEVMPLVGSSGLVDLGTSSGGSFERYNREGMADVVPSHVLIRDPLTFRLQSSLVALGEGSLEQLHRLCVAANLSLDVGKVRFRHLLVYNKL